MTPLKFEELYQAEWQELEDLLDRVLGRKKKAASAEPLRGERIATLYRRACEQLALARARSYPAYLVDRLDRLTADAHQVIYQQREFGAGALWRIFARDFPRAVRADAVFVSIAAALFVIPTIVLGVVVYYRPDLILSVVDAATAAQFEQMYSTVAESIGRTRDAGDDWTMFGFYIRNNVGVAFQCFASGLAAGIGSIFYLVYNGAMGGAVAGYLTERGLGETFYSFVVTHGSFELTAIVLSGAAGLKLGHSLLAPGRRTRGQSLVVAAKDCVVIVYGVAAMLVVAAALEAFWSSSAWVPHGVKYGVAAVCWLAVFAYLALQGRDAA
ncbi:MAG TPA: stage II sporulation protein M [Gammaproteobacteria bacterium]|nr:stage II sporulation protein M [Gammaproteobacteria bacterium]